MKKKFLLLLLFSSKVILACECPVLKPISKELYIDYDVIFYGKVDSVSICKQGISIAYFTIQELYKGTVEKEVKVNFDCVSECLMSFEKGEEWLMYTKYKRFDLLTVHICDHSRKQFADLDQDIYQLTAKRTFEEEKEFLRSNLGIISPIRRNDLNQQQNELGPSNTQPGAWTKLVLLLVSLSVMLGVYYVTKKKKGN
jgi:hypothetical protein